MDLNNIELPAFLIADLYHSALIEADAKLPKTKVFNETSHKLMVSTVDNNGQWKYLGHNQKNILVMVNNKEAMHLPDNELTFLTGILGACKLSLADIVIVNLNNHPVSSYKELTSFFKSKIVFLFGIEPATFGLPINFPHYQIQAFAGNSFLHSPSLKELENDKVEKSKLWVCLKRLFNL